MIPASLALNPVLLETGLGLEENRGHVFTARSLPGMIILANGESLPGLY